MYKYDEKSDLDNRTNTKYYKIKITTNRKRRNWLSWSNASNSDGFYLTDECICKIFPSESLECGSLADYLKGEKYELHQIDDISDIRSFRIYNI